MPCMPAPYTGRGQAGAAAAPAAEQRRGARAQPEPGGRGQVGRGVHVPAQAGPVAGQRQRAARRVRRRRAHPEPGLQRHPRPVRRAAPCRCPAASATNRRTPGAAGRDRGSAAGQLGRAQRRQVGGEAGHPGVPAGRRGAVPEGAFSPASGASGTTRAPAAASCRRHPGVVGHHQHPGRPPGRPAPRGPCRPPGPAPAPRAVRRGSAPRRRLFAAARRFTGTTTVQLGSATRQSCQSGGGTLTGRTGGEQA